MLVVQCIGVMHATSGCVVYSLVSWRRPKPIALSSALGIGTIVGVMGKAALGLVVAINIALANL
jgi:hypothetical protein